MKTFFTMLVLAVAAYAGEPTRTTVREFEVPQPPITVTEMVPVQKQVPQPPRKFQEITQTWTRELGAPAQNIAPQQYAPQYIAPVQQYLAPQVLPPIYITPVQYAAPVQYAPPTNDVTYYRKRLLGGTTTRWADGTEIRRGPLGHIRSLDRPTPYK